MSGIELPAIDIERVVARRRMYTFRPFGHPETLCPDGTLWRAHANRGEWIEWSNKPWQTELINAGHWAIERAAFTANGVGKTEVAAYEVACHLTGWYPDWWAGKRFDRPVLAWSNARSNDSQREYTQPALLGPNLADALGTGMIPAHLFARKDVRTRQAGLPDVVDTVLVRRHDGKGISTLRFKTYEMGWEAQSGGRPQLIWNDEEPDDFKIYTEGITRILRNNGVMLSTLTPLKGETELTMHFMRQAIKNCYWIGASWDDVPHLTQKMKDHLRASYPAHEHDARVLGVPMMGMGRIFVTPEDSIVCMPFEIPSYFRRLKGIDFGFDHPAALAEIAIDVDKDIVYLVSDWRGKVDDYYDHVAAINAREPWIPVAWPHDGKNRQASGKPLASLYREAGVKMLGKQACIRSDRLGPQPLEPMIEEIKAREVTGRLKIFSTCRAYLEERRSYHRNEKGEPSSIHDDVLKAFFYALMMRRYGAARNWAGVVSRPPSAPIMSVR